jgi:SAM-dependent methyltransferase
MDSAGSDMNAPGKHPLAPLPERPPLPAPAVLASSGHRGVVECYSGPFHRIVFKGAGLSGYNEGRYADDPRRPHDEAHRLQNQRIIEQALHGGPGGTWRGTHRPRILDIGCGNGDLLDRARSLGIDSVGITLIPEQVDECTRRGLTAYKLNYRDIGPEWTGQFDAVVLKGSVEHFVQPADVIAGRDRAIYEELFAILARVIDPRSPAGRVCNSTIMYRRRPDPRDIVKHPLSHRYNSDAYHYAWLHHMYSGWHPMLGELAERAKGHFVLECEEDISEDYRLSAEYCLGVIKRAWTSPRMWREALVSLAKFPTSTLTHAWGLYISQSTNWYFRGSDPPTLAQLQTWKRVDA